MSSDDKYIYSGSKDGSIIRCKFHNVFAVKFKTLNHLLLGFAVYDFIYVGDFILKGIAFANFH